MLSMKSLLGFIFFFNGEKADLIKIYFQYLPLRVECVLKNI